MWIRSGLYLCELYLDRILETTSDSRFGMKYVVVIFKLQCVYIYVYNFNVSMECEGVTFNQVSHAAHSRGI